MLAFGLPVTLFAALVLPLHLGWIGASWLGFAGYLVTASTLLSLAGAVLRRSDYPDWSFAVPQALLSLMALAIPAVLTFQLGAMLGPVEERIDENVCASHGEAEADSAAAEADDTFDVTPDCIPAP